VTEDREHDFQSVMNSALQPLQSRIALHQRIHQCLSKILPAALMRHTRMSCVENDQLILICDTPAWASDLRYRQSEILQSVNFSQKLSLTGCKILVRPEIFR
jgi:hypothetical protein